jgi:SWI/SNF-related matrix-associated actin-dependent regulator of chromatin subfamily A3
MRKYVLEWCVLEASLSVLTDCYRRVIDVTQLREVEIQIICIRSKDLKAFESIGSDEDVFVYLDLIFGQDRCDVQFKGINIGTMQTKTQHALQQLMSHSKEKVRFKALVHREDLKEKLDTVMQPLGVNKSKLAWSMNIQIFGVRSISDMAAKDLSKYRLFLQHPCPTPFNATYENPQYLSMVGSSFINGAVLPPISMDASRPEIEPNAVTEESDHGLDELRAVINDLPKHDYLREAVVDERVNTDMLRQVYNQS